MGKGHLAAAVLRRIWDALLACPGATSAALARTVERDRTSVSQTLSRWAEAGCVVRAVDPNDARTARWWPLREPADLCAENPAVPVEEIGQQALRAFLLSLHDERGRVSARLADLDRRIALLADVIERIDAGGA